MNVKRSIFGVLARARYIGFLIIILFVGARASALPVTGKPVPQLAAFDAEMQGLMAEFNLDAGVLGVMKNGCIIYLRGFGYDYSGTQALPEITPMRLASVSKPLTAAAINDLANRGLLGRLGLNKPAFDLGQPGGGILSIADLDDGQGGSPWPSLQDARMKNITVKHLLEHTAGWPYGWEFNPIGIATQMGITSPPGAKNTTRFMLGRTLLYDPGSVAPYSDYNNFNYQVLSLIIEKASGVSHITYLRQRIATPDMWVPSTDLFKGRTFRADQNPREPLYRGSGLATNVYNPAGPQVPECYGGMDYEQAVGWGGTVATAATLLKFRATLGPSGGWAGSLPGTSTGIFSYAGADIVILLNDRRSEPDKKHLASIGLGRIAAAIDALITTPGFQWPTACVDGVWVNFNLASSGTGGYSDALHSMPSVLARVTDGTRLRIKGGSTPWTGTITTKLLIDAPMGTVTIGQSP